MLAPSVGTGRIFNVPYKPGYISRRFLWISVALALGYEIVFHKPDSITQRMTLLDYGFRDWLHGIFPSFGPFAIREIARNLPVILMVLVYVFVRAIYRHVRANHTINGNGSGQHK